MKNRYVDYDNILEKRHRLGLDEMSNIHKVNAFNIFINELPIVDVVEVVRCKDCTFCLKNDDNEYLCSATTNPNYVTLDHFCSYGERKKDNDL